MFEYFDQAAQNIGSVFAGRDHSAPTAESPQECRPEDAGPFGFLGGIGQTIGDFGRGLEQEGLSGLIDPMGMLDRQDAQRELANQFNILDPSQMVSGPGGPGAYAGNQVSPEEFQQIARTYSDVRMGRTNFQFDIDEMSEEDQAEYRRNMMTQFGRILQTDSGRGLVNDIAYNEDGHQVTLGAFYQEDAAGNPTNVLDPTNAVANPTNEPNAANGTGSGSAVQFNPGVESYNIGAATDPWNATRSDVVLYHELSHAWNQVHGTEDQSGAVMPGEAGLDGTERDANDGSIQRWEHQAVGLGNHANTTGPSENRYRRERAEIGAAGGPGIVDGDVGMPTRDHYGH